MKGYLILYMIIYHQQIKSKLLLHLRESIQFGLECQFFHHCTFQRLWMAKEEYEENGPAFIDIKCPSSFSKYQQNHKIFQPNYKKILNHSHKSGNISFQFN